jgi:hypothetical protein
MYEMLKADDTVMTDHLAPYVVSYLILSLDVYFEFAPNGTTKESIIKESIGLFIEVRLVSVSKKKKSACAKKQKLN